MMKNIQWDIKTKIKTVLIIFVMVLVPIIFESVSRDWLSAKMILTQLGASVAFAAFLIVTLDEKSYALTGVQSAVTIVAFAFLFGITVSQKTYNHDVLRTLLFLPLLLICSQVTVLMPVAALISAYLAVELESAALICIPPAVGASLIYLSPSVKESALWKKILFAASELALIAAGVYSLWRSRYAYTVHSLVTDICDSSGIAVVFVLLIAFAVVFVMKKRTSGEFVGCILAAAFSAASMFLPTARSLPSSAAMLMMLSVICRSGTPAEEIIEKAFTAVCSKLKKAKKQPE